MYVCMYVYDINTNSNLCRAAAGGAARLARLDLSFNVRSQGTEDMTRRVAGMMMMMMMMMIIIII